MNGCHKFMEDSQNSPAIQQNCSAKHFTNFTYSKSSAPAHKAWDTLPLVPFG